MITDIFACNEKFSLWLLYLHSTCLAYILVGKRKHKKLLNIWYKVPLQSAFVFRYCCSLSITNILSCKFLPPPFTRGKRLFGAYLYIKYLKIKLNVKTYDSINLGVCLINNNDNYSDFYSISVLSNNLELFISRVINYFNLTGEIQVKL